MPTRKSLCPRGIQRALPGAPAPHFERIITGRAAVLAGDGNDTHVVDSASNFVAGESSRTDLSGRDFLKSGLVAASAYVITSTKHAQTDETVVVPPPSARTTLAVGTSVTRSDTFSV